MLTRPNTCFDIIEGSIGDLFNINLMALIPGIVIAIIATEIALPAFVGFNVVMGALAVRKQSTYTAIECDSE